MWIAPLCATDTVRGAVSHDDGMRRGARCFGGTLQSTSREFRTLKAATAGNRYCRVGLYLGTYSRSCNPKFASVRKVCLYFALTMRVWKKLVIVFIALWLPLQGYGAVAMPFCAHGPSMPDSSASVSAHTDSDDREDVAHVTDGIHDHAVSQDSSSSDKSSHKHAGLGCNDCGPCQLACAPLIFSTVPHFASNGSPVYDPTPIASLTSVSPEQLQRPPLPAFA